MSTRCRISAVYKDGSVHSIYCHHDGYVKDGVGECLYCFYKDLPKIKELMDLGDLSCLGTTAAHDPKEWNKPFSFDGTKCLVYKDRGEEDSDALVYSNEQEFQKAMIDRGWTDEEFEYLYKDGVWYLLDSDYKCERKVCDILR